MSQEVTHNIRVRAIGAAAVVAAALLVSVVTSTVVASRAYMARGAQQQSGERTISVTGYARQRITADAGEWRITVAGRGPTLGEAYAVLESGVVSLDGFLSARGFKPSEVSLLPIDTTVHQARDERGRDTEVVAGYTLKRTAVVRTSEVARVAASAGAVTSLLEQNIEIESRSPEFTVSDLDQLKIDVAGLASADARKRAEAIATEAGCRVVDVRDARLGVIQITQPDSTEVRSYGMYDTSTIDKDIAVTVNLRLGIEAVGR